MMMEGWLKDVEKCGMGDGNSEDVNLKIEFQLTCVDCSQTAEWNEFAKEFKNKLLIYK